jgi:hypothetical protein
MRNFVNPKERKAVSAIPARGSTLMKIRKGTSKLDVFFDAAIALLAFLVTAFTIYPIFSGEFSQNWGSIESAFLSDAVFIVENYPHVGWYPYWYGGIPFHLSYTPLLPYLVACLHFLMGWSVAHAYRVLTGIAYAATPAALYVLTKYVSRSRVAGIIASFAYALIPTFFQGLTPSHIEILTVYGEGPHTFTLPFLLLAVAVLLHNMRRPTSIRYVTTAILVAVVALTNVIALFAFALFALVALAAEIVYGRSGQAFRVFVASVLLSYGLVAFQFDPQFIQASASFGAGGGVSFVGLLSSPWLPVIFITLTLVPGGLMILRHSLGKSERTRVAFLGLVWTALFGTIVLSKQLFGLSLAPQPIRYTPELDLSAAFLIGLVTAGVAALVIRFRPEPSQSFRHLAKVGITGLVLSVLIFSSTVTLLPLSYRVTAPSTSIADVPEYRIAAWLSSHVTDERIYATGTPGFWLNAFSNVQQIRGGSEQGAVNSWWAPVGYEINTGVDPQLSVLWAKAWNVKYIVVTFPNATTAYHDYLSPDEFSGVLPLTYYYQGFGIYEVPLTQPTLVQCVSAQSAASLQPISDISDRQDLSNYVSLVNLPPIGPHATYSMPNPDEIVISVSNASTDTAILVKMTFDERWHADIDNKSVPIASIGPDFMIASPQATGNYHLVLNLQQSGGEVVGYFLTLITIVLTPILIIVTRFLPRFRKKQI